ncbi:MULTISPECIES: helix-turn-helix domain-containing protein [unclassified Paenibacillus]|uniref:Helix-turn-helix domain-containing protein n=2 Tax=Bacillati TaxID=1783272 RepID=A0ABW3Q9V2_9BACL|nr:MULTISPECIES: hypothetical protein [unclassified Paenibacillus]MCM3130619.1 helix-turn-helix domain-containing protein [Paenibacillus sp. MER 78]SDX74331.1 hypothetical protein SAMN05518848_11351 [Paenibacillus sp. PDC88]SFS89739.1 hypothetical protein SAMN04488601_106171 [Paenibacillus sp. 453mf]
MPKSINHSNQFLFDGIKSILNNSDLKTYEKIIMIVIKMHQEEYGDVFPDYDTIAAAGGMSKRKAQYVVKDLQARNMIEKFSRFKEVADGTRKQTSNRYTIVDEQVAKSKNDSDAQHAQKAQDAPITNSPCAQDAPYNSGFENQESLDLYPSTDLKDEEEYITREREKQSKTYACYAQVFNEMIKDHGTGILSFKQEEFLETCKVYNLPVRLVSELYPQIKKEIQKFHYEAIHRTFDKFITYLVKRKIANPIAWFVSTFRNENLKVLTELGIRFGKIVS